ncbi:hypothetical protein J7E73_17820 [Paenibacillus albidus]|uniref:hypothetical protein n=1 Tax=Paenibacillus albidus TaxID=2041023 RepID=UPI001BEBD3A0|nr:hypothetical protein [Paenibacillus albidus]MBT2290959.1 hypothetical protein [Paenibacillus albidus]
MKKFVKKTRFIAPLLLLSLSMGACAGNDPEVSSSQASATSTPATSTPATSKPVIHTPAASMATIAPFPTTGIFNKEKVMGLAEEFLKSYGTNNWNTKKSQKNADAIREEMADYQGRDKYDVLLMVEHMEDEDIEAVAEAFGEMGGTVPSFRAQPSPTTAPTPTPEAMKRITLVGKGNQATELFELESGFAVIDAKNTGDSNFIVHIMDESGNNEDSVTNEIGPYKGKSLVTIPDDGKYLFNVTAEGSWEMHISQTVPNNILSAPTKLYGKGNDVVFVNLQAKLTRFSFKHVGESNFIVHVNDNTSIANEIGNYSGSTAKTVESDGTYIFSIKADGQWSIDIN